MIISKDIMRWLLVSLLVLGLFSSAYGNPTPAGDDKDSDEDPDNPDDSPEDRDEDKDGEEDQSLLVILLGGFRWDYPEHCEMFAFKKLEAEGVTAPYLNPVFPTLTYPNAYSLATGKYPENHGIVGDVMFDKEAKELFLPEPNPNSTKPHWWDEAEPIWITATKNNRKAALYRWPGCQVEFGSVKPYRCVPYSGVESVEDFSQNLDKAVSEIKENGVRLAMVYVDHADKVAHEHGPTSDNAMKAVRELDKTLLELLTDMQNAKIADDVNVIVVSDHGMQDTSPEKISEIELSSVINIMDIKYVLDSRAYVGIVPFEGKLDKIYTALKSVEGLNVYKKDDIPERLHLDDNARTPPLVLVAKSGYYIEGFENTPKQVPAEAASADNDNDTDGKDDDDPTNYKGTDGYDPEDVTDMRGIFYAAGPAFKDHFEGDPISIVDLYNIMADIIDVAPLPNDGAKDDMMEYLRPDDDDATPAAAKTDDDDDDDDDSAESVARVSLLVTLVCLLVTKVIA